jgi:hypothetical protein
MAKFKKIKANIDGWSDWELPVMEGYKLGCCDCGLVHDTDFKIVWTVTDKDGDVKILHHRIVGAEQRVMFRANRNNRSTGQIRRHDGISIQYDLTNK